MGFEVEYMTLLVYLSPNKKGSPKYIETCTSVIQEIKRASPDIIRLVCQRISQKERLRNFIADSTFVGIPSSSIKGPDSLHGPRSLALALEQFGGAQVDLLNRRLGLPKSAFIRIADERPSPTQHADSLNVHSNLRVSPRILLVDDLLTSGRTAMGAALAVHACYPESNIRLFSVFRNDRIEPPSGKLLQVRKGVMSLNDDGNVDFHDEQIMESE